MKVLLSNFPHLNEFVFGAFDESSACPRKKFDEMKLMVTEFHAIEAEQEIIAAVGPHGLTGAYNLGYEGSEPTVFANYILEGFL